MSENHPSIARRTLTSTAAWTVPALAVAIGAPLAAASTPGIVTASLSQSVFHVNQNHLNVSTVFLIDGAPLRNATFTVVIADSRFSFDRAGGSGGVHYGTQTSSTGAAGTFTGAVKIDETKPQTKVDAHTSFIFTLHLPDGTTQIVSVPVTLTHDNGR